MSLAHLVALSHFGHIGPIAYRKLITHLGTIEDAWRAPSIVLQSAGISEKTADRFVDWRTKQDPDALFADATRRGMQVLSMDDAAYPTLLKTIHDPPFLLYYRGAIPPGDALAVGVVGSRRATEYGLRIAEDFSRDLAQAGVAVVSGLAWGIDEAAHRATLAVNGKTVAVLGCGLDGNDAARKRKLADDIVAHGGAVISEFAPEVPSLTHHFPIRNRIIAGMSKGTLIVEAAEKSGSLITARAALEEGREVFAVPGPITSPTSHGTNRLCKEGAHVATCAADILEVLGVQQSPVPHAPTTPTTPEAEKIVAALSTSPMHIDDIVAATRMPAAAVMTTLSLLEMQGAVRHLGGMRYIR